MKYEASTKTGTFEKKPKIEKGYYAAQLIEFKPRQKEDGTPIESKFGGKQGILLFRICDKKTFETIKITEANLEKDLILASVVNTTYKDKETGKERSAFTPNSRVTKTFQALGWVLDPETGIDTDDYINKWCEVNIDDGDYKWTNDKNEEETYKASQIKDIAKLEGDHPSSSSSTPAPEEKKPVNVKKTLNHEALKEEPVDDFKAKEGDSEEVKTIKHKMELMKESLDEQRLTQKGYDMAMEQLKEELHKAGGS